MTIITTSCIICPVKLSRCFFSDFFYLLGEYFCFFLLVRCFAWWFFIFIIFTCPVVGLQIVIGQDIIDEVRGIFLKEKRRDWVTTSKSAFRTMVLTLVNLSFYKFQNDRYSNIITFQGKTFIIQKYFETSRLLLILPEK